MLWEAGLKVAENGNHIERYLWDNNVKGDISAQVFISIFILAKKVNLEGSVQELENDVWDFWDVNIDKVIATIDTSIVSWHGWKSTSLTRR